MFRKLLPLVCAGAALIAAGQAAAAEHTVQMLNRGPGGAMVFSPAVVPAHRGMVTEIPLQLSAMPGAGTPQAMRTIRLAP